MNKLFALLLAGFCATSFAASHAGAPMKEAMKAENPKGEAKAQTAVDAKAKTGDKAAKQPEAMKAGSDKAQAAAGKKNDAKPAVAKKSSTDDQMKKDASKL